MKKNSKKSTFDPIQFITHIVSFSPRQHEGEMKTADFLQGFLQDRNIPFYAQKFTTTVPVQIKASLKADGEEIPCRSVSLVSGDIDNKNQLASSGGDIDEYTTTPTITFNPYCEVISCAVFFHNAPALAVARGNVDKILRAKKIQGTVQVKPTKYIARNILVGNTVNPKTICFAHYDCILTGAWDNAGGVASMMGAILSAPQSLQDTLFVFTANEELSYDKKPAYWCRGFRQFEKKYLSLLERAEKIIVVDGVGISPSYWMTEYRHLESTILINNLKKLLPKTMRLGASTSKVASAIYHSEADTPSGIKSKYILQTIKQLTEKILE